jgi:carbonic anhydrase
LPHTWDPTAIPPAQALQRLAEGNRRFRESRRRSPRRWSGQLATQAQRPFAIVLGCSDSRTPVEILFDQGFGDLFVVRLAGNIVAPSVLGSIEFAASQFGTRLVVVMGHTRCGAVAATVRAIETGLGPESKNIRSITDRIAPDIAHIAGTDDPEQRVNAAVRAHVRASMDRMRHGSIVLEELVASGRVAIVGAVYELETGAVQVLEAATPAAAQECGLDADVALR